MCPPSHGVWVLVCQWVAFEGLVGAAGEFAFGGADGVASGAPLLGSSGEVVVGFFVVLELGVDGDVDDPG